jgi:hypothetical protein
MAIAADAQENLQLQIGNAAVYELLSIRLNPTNLQAHVLMVPKPAVFSYHQMETLARRGNRDEGGLTGGSQNVNAARR